MTKPTAEEFLLAAEGPLHPDPGVGSIVMTSDARHYGNMRAEEERERIVRIIKEDGWINCNCQGKGVLAPEYVCDQCALIEDIEEVDDAHEPA